MVPGGACCCCDGTFSKSPKSSPSPSYIINRSNVSGFDAISWIKLKKYCVNLGRWLLNLGQDWLQSGWVTSDDLLELSELRAVNQLSQNGSIHLSSTTDLSLLPWFRVFGNVAIQKVLNSSVRIVPGGFEGFDNLVSGESHGHDFVDDCFTGLILLLGLRFGFRLGFSFFLLFGRFRLDLLSFGGFFFFLLFFLWLWFLELGRNVLWQLS